MQGAMRPLLLSSLLLGAVNALAIAWALAGYSSVNNEIRRIERPDYFPAGYERRLGFGRERVIFSYGIRGTKRLEIYRALYEHPQKGVPQAPRWSTLRNVDPLDPNWLRQEDACGWPLLCLRSIVRDTTKESLLDQRKFFEWSVTGDLSIVKQVYPDRRTSAKRGGRLTRVSPVVVQGGLVVLPSPPRKSKSARILPTIPIWIGLIGNTLFYSVIWAALISTAITLHRWNGRRRGICLTCGYDVRAAPGRCPECGYIDPT